LIYKNSIDEVKQRILERVDPRVFINAHFGNLVLEFFNPSDGRAMPPTRQELMTWSQKNLSISLNSTNSYALLRIYNSYKRFRRFIEDSSQRKDLRHIQPLLSEPGLFTPKGIQLIIMDEYPDNQIIMKCPTFGVSMDRNKTNDFAFISRNMKSTSSTENIYARYELFIHTSNIAARGGQGDIHETIVKWNYSTYEYWPEIVQKRVNEYMNQCQSRHRSIYTSQQGIHSMAMITLSKIIEVSPTRPEGIIKDSYNHIVGVTYRLKVGSDYMIPLPVVDDGVTSISSAFSIKSIYLDWNDFHPAPIEVIVKFYKKNIETLLSLYPGYGIQYIVRDEDDDRIIAFQLKNGIYLPASPPRNEKELESFGLTTVRIKEFEWELNKQIVGLDKEPNMNDWEKYIGDSVIEKRCGSDSELLRKSTKKQLEELYQQFRVMVANWITSYRAGSEVRKGIEEIVFHPDLPEYEKRKRLSIFIEPTLLSWFYLDEKEWEIPDISFLRKDCRVINDEEGCTGTCYWKKDEAKCLLHVNAKTSLSEGGQTVNTGELFTKRIMDELIRFPQRRKQLIREGEISKVVTIQQPIRMGDQYIIPESSPMWTDLLRLEWTKQVPEEHKYYEEMTREQDKGNIQKIEGEMPDELVDLFGRDTLFRLKLVTISQENKPLTPFMAMLGITLDQLELKENTSYLSRDDLTKYVKLTMKPIGMIDLTEKAEENKEIQFMRPITGSYDRVTIFVFLPNIIGLLIQEEGNPTVQIDLLPELVKDKWNKAARILVKKKMTLVQEPKIEELQELKREEPNPTIAIPTIKKPLIMSKRPLIMRAKETEEPLVQVPIEQMKQPQIMKIEDLPQRVMKRPGIGVLTEKPAPALPPPIEKPVIPEPQVIKRPGIAKKKEEAPQVMKRPGIGTKAKEVAEQASIASVMKKPGIGKKSNTGTTMKRPGFGKLPSTGGYESISFGIARKNRTLRKKL
jgi:hypothetical protein